MKTNKIKEEIEIDLTRTELDNIMKKRFKGDSYEVRVQGLIPIDIQEAITFFIEGYKTGFSKSKEQVTADFIKKIDDWANDCDVHPHNENSVCQNIDVSKLKQMLVEK